MNFYEKKADVMKLLDEETTKSNKELLITAAICTAVGLVLGFVFGKLIGGKSAVKKYNKCFSYDFGDDIEEFEDEE